MGELMADKTPQRIVYVGDGTNDFCAAMALEENDVVLARSGYSLAKLLTANSHMVYLPSLVFCLLLHPHTHPPTLTFLLTRILFR